MRPHRPALAITLAFGLAVSAASAQSPQPVSLGFGIDTTRADVRSIVRLAVAYVARNGTAPLPDPLWLDAEQRAGRRHDLAANFVFQGFPATVVGVIPTGPANDEYVVKLLFARIDGTGNVQPIALERLYAVRQAGDWRLSGALDRLTRDWTIERTGLLRFHYAPGFTPDVHKREQAAAFVDSVARMFAVPPPPLLDYYVTRSTEEYHRILGLDFFVLPSGPDEGRGGQAIPEADVVLAGDPQQGEAYLHELVHSVLQRDTPRSSWNGIVTEGIATWLGGSRGRPAASMIELLRDYQRQYSQTTLRQLLEGPSPFGWRKEETDAFYATGALIAATAMAESGVRGLRALLATEPGTDAAFAAIERIRPASTRNAEDWWRTYRIDQRARP